jgi:hypothetical protein
MKTPLTQKIVLLTGGALMGLALNSQAQIIQNNQTDFSSATAFTGSIAVNLIQAGQSSLAGVTAPTSALNGTFSAAGLNDGSAAGNINKTYYAVIANSGGDIMPDTITFLLTGAYDISQIQVISGWSDHNLGEQIFDVSLAINNGAFNSIGIFTNNASVTTGGSAVGSWLTTLTDADGIIASAVTGIQFTFMNPDTSNGNGVVGNSQAGGGSSGGTLIQELQVFGAPTTVPEPSTLALFGFAGAGLLMLRRRLTR